MTSFCALMCHAPIVVPAVGRGEARRCARTTRAMREVAARTVAAMPDRLVVLSPHSPRRDAEWSAWSGPRHVGDLGPFRAPEIRVDLPDAPEIRMALGLSAIPSGPLDHGAMVPLSFLWEAGWRGPTAILALSWDEGGAERIGEALARLDGRTAVIASGDMSHRLRPDAPAGYHPRAAEFDRAFVDALDHHRWSKLNDLPWRGDAAEDVVTSTRAAQASVPGPLHDEVLSYEGPWGVGYTEAVFYDPEPPLYAIARKALRAKLLGQPRTRELAGRPGRPVFVTLRTSRDEGHDLRGCVGHIEARPNEDLYDTIADIAIAAGTGDPRFDPVTPDELGDLTFEVSVLSEPHPLHDRASHDPRTRGLIVTAGRRRGLLLPDVEGIDTLEEQESICRQKGGLSPTEPATLTWFEVDKETQPS